MKLKVISALVLLVVLSGTVSAARPSQPGLRHQVEELTIMVKALRQELRKTRAELASVRKDLEKVQSNTVLGLDGRLRLENVAGQDTAIFESVNVQLINGTGMTPALNGLGNLVIGYNVDSRGLASRFGSHNIILGDDQSYSNAEELVAGNIVSSHDLSLNVSGNLNTLVGISQQTTVGADQTTTVGTNQTITVGTNQTTTVGADQTTTVGSNKTISIGGDRTEQIAGMSSLSIGLDASLNIGSNMNLSIARTAVIDSGDQITLQTGEASNIMKKDGDIVIEGKDITIKASGDIVLKGKKILEN